jgi:hypothetical protein
MQCLQKKFMRVDNTEINLIAKQIEPNSKTGI